MEIIIADDYEQMSRMAADYVGDLLKKKPNAWLGMTTGNTPKGLYSHLASDVREGRICLEKAKIVSTEEYLGAGAEQEMSLIRWLDSMLLDPCGIKPDQVLRIPGDHVEPSLACQAFDEAISAHGGLDLIVEGIGLNGHIGFNEPGSPRDSHTRIVKLMNTTLDYNYHYWNDSIPSYGFTIGMHQVLKAQRILLVASGSHKAQILQKALRGPVSDKIPASLLQTQSQVTVIADREAAAYL